MQVANSFDPVTTEKVMRSLMWACLSGLSSGLTCYLTTNDVRASVVTGLIAILAPFLPNTAMQYGKGQ